MTKKKTTKKKTTSKKKKSAPKKKSTPKPRPAPAPTVGHNAKMAFPFYSTYECEAWLKDLGIKKSDYILFPNKDGNGRIQVHFLNITEKFEKELREKHGGKEPSPYLKDLTK